MMDIKRQVFRRLDAALPPQRSWPRTRRASRSRAGRRDEPARAGRGAPLLQPRQRDEAGGGHPRGHHQRGDDGRRRELATALGKVPVRVRECPGFLVNRVLLRALVGGLPSLGRAGRRPRRGRSRRGRRRARPDGPVRARRPDRARHARPHPARPGGGLRRALRRRGRDRPSRRRRPPGNEVRRRFLRRRPDGGEPPTQPAARWPARYYASALDEARRCVEEEIAAPGDVDLAMRYGCGWETGPLEWARSTEASPAG